jgi:DNA-directed RNA polymerase beta' subunit
MKKIVKLTESDLTRIIRRVINEENIENSELCLGLISDVIINNFSDILYDAKMMLEENGGTFENGETPTDRDWKMAEDGLMQSLIDAKV